MSDSKKSDTSLEDLALDAVRSMPALSAADLEAASRRSALATVESTSFETERAAHAVAAALRSHGWAWPIDSEYEQWRWRHGAEQLARELLAKATTPQDWQPRGVAAEAARIAAMWAAADRRAAAERHRFEEAAKVTGQPVDVLRCVHATGADALSWAREQHDARRERTTTLLTAGFAGVTAFAVAFSRRDQEGRRSHGPWLSLGVAVGTACAARAIMPVVLRAPEVLHGALGIARVAGKVL